MKLSKKEYVWLWVRALVLPVIFILPFFTSHFQQIACQNPTEFSGPCYVTGSGWSEQFGLLAFWVGFALLFTVISTVQRGKAKADFAKLQMRYTLLSVAFTVLAFGILYQFSEGRLLHLLNGNTAPTEATIKKVMSPPFGVSFPPAFLAVFSMLYLVSPVMLWRTFTTDKSRVAGIKKKELFQ